MGKNKKKMNPFAGKHVGGSTSATRLPSTGKKKRPPAAAADGSGGDGGGGGRRKKDKSVLGLLVAGAGFAALWVWNVWARGQQSKSDRDVLAAMARRPLAITDHAACRMECRFVGRAEVEEGLRQGRINARKSQPALRPCPKYTVDATVGPRGRRKNVQVAVAACPTETRLITVIDRDTNHPCGPC